VTTVTVEVVKSLLSANDAVALRNRARLDQAGLLGVNLMSAPGSGKTTLLARTMNSLGAAAPCGVLVGDLQTSRDAERLADHAAVVHQINTGKGCHLTATQVENALGQIAIQGLAFLFIENVGNMVCPATYALGERRRVALLSVTEGDDKVLKYPTLFQAVDAVLLTKIDLLQVLDFDVQRVEDDLRQLNAHVPLLQLSTRSGEGFARWLTWLHDMRAEIQFS